MASSLTIASSRRALAFAAGVAAAASLFASASVSAQTCTPCESASAGEVPSQEPQALQLALDAFAAAGGGSDHLVGAGGALRIGEVFPYMGASLIPEVGFDFLAFSGDTPTNVFGGFLGGRVRFGKGIVPGLFAHTGVAGVRWRNDYVASTADVGVSVDATFIPKVLLGIQGAYKSTIASGGNPALGWYTAGATIGMRL